MYDIGIVGAGPAGSTLARLLADRYRILLLDSGRSKCCGGILAPEAQKMFAKLDLAIPKEVLVDPQPFAVAVVDLQTRLVRRYARQYINIDRAAFDRWLLSLVPASVDVRHHAIYRHSTALDNGALEIRFTQNGGEHVEKVHRLVGADGPFSSVRREFFAHHPQPKRYVALQHWFDAETVSCNAGTKKNGINFREDYIGFFDADLTDFYSWSIPKDKQIILGAAIPFGEDVRKKFDLFLSKLNDFGLRFDVPVHREAGQLVRPLCLRSMCPGSDRVILLGEAAGLISPSSAEGIGAALASAYQLGRSFGANGFEPTSYRRNIRMLRWGLLTKIAKIPIMFHPWLRKYVMLSGWTSLDKQSSPRQR